MTQLLHALAGFAAWLALAGLAFGLVAWRRELIKPFSKLPRRGLAILLGVMALHAIALKPLIPHNIWHEQLGVEAILHLEEGRTEGHLDSLHGPGFAVVMKALRTATLGEASPFTLNYLLSSASVLLLFLILLLASGEELLALAGALTLLLLPAHMRLAVTESMFVTLECLTLLALLLLTVHLKTKERAPFFLGVLAALLAMWTRAEMMALLPVVFAVYAAALHKTAPAKRRVLALLPGLAAAGALSGPRLLEMALLADARAKELVPAAGLAHFWDLGVRGLNVFFDPAYTPPAWMALAAGGLVFLYRRNRRLFAAVAFHGVLLTYFYAIHLTCLSLRVRTGAATQYLFAAAAGCGLYWLARELRGGGRSRKRRLAAYAVILGLTLPMPLFHADFLSTVYTKQAEYRFLSGAAERLPDRAVVVYLSQDDDPGVFQHRIFQKTVFETRAREVGRAVATAGIRELLRKMDELSLEDVYYYEGAACYSAPYMGAGPAPPAPTAGYMNPLCRSMSAAFELEPMTRTHVTGESNSWDPVAGTGVSIGLYRVLARKGRGELRPRESAWTLFGSARPDEGPAGTLVKLAEGAKKRGKRRTALLALAASRVVHRGIKDRRLAALNYLDLGEPARARRLLERLVRERPSDPRLWTALGQAALAAGDPKGASPALERAAGLDPNPEETGRIAALLQEMGEFDRALVLLDRMLARRPDDARLLSDRGVLKALSGKPDEAAKDLREAIKLEPSLLSAYLTLGGVHAAAGRRTAALKVYDEALNAPGPAEAPIRRMIAEERAKLGRD